MFSVKFGTTALPIEMGYGIFWFLFIEVAYVLFICFHFHFIQCHSRRHRDIHFQIPSRTVGVHMYMYILSIFKLDKVLFRSNGINIVGCLKKIFLKTCSSKICFLPFIIDDDLVTSSKHRAELSAEHFYTNSMLKPLAHYFVPSIDPFHTLYCIPKKIFG